MNVSVIVATFGDLKWEQLGHERAMPSARAECPYSLTAVHLHEGTLAEARNLGAEGAEGDWLCFLDADDELAPGYLAAMEAHVHAPFVEQLQQEMARPVTDEPTPSLPLPKRPLELLVPAVQYVGNSQWAHQRPRRITPPKVLNDGRPLYEINRAVIGTLVPRELFLEVGGFSGDLATLEDWELWLRCERAGAALVDVPDAVYRVHLRENSRNTDQSLYWQIRNAYEPTKGAA